MLEDQPFINSLKLKVSVVDFEEKDAVNQHSFKSF